MKIKNINTVILLLLTIFVVACGREKGDSEVIKLEKKISTDTLNVEIMIELGRLYHERANPEKAVRILGKAVKIEKDSPIALIYLGSSYTMMAGQAEKVEDKLSYLEKGMRILDETAEKYPDNYEVRLIRGVNSMNIPDMFGRYRIAIKDFEYILSSVDSIPKSEERIILEYLKIAYLKAEENEKASLVENKLDSLMKNDSI